MLNKVCVDTKILDILTGSELKLFMIVNSYDEGLGAYVSTKRISKDHNIPLRTVQRIRKRLVEKGLLVVTKKEGHTFWEWTFKERNAKNGVCDKSNEKGKEIRIHNNEKNRNVKNDVVCSSSFKYKNTTTTYSAKNGVFKNEGVETIENTDIREDAKNDADKNTMIENAKKLIPISRDILEKAVEEYSIDEIKKAVVYTYRQKAKKPETYFLMTLKKGWALDANMDDFDIEIKRLEDEKIKKMRIEEERKRRIEMKRIEEEKQMARSRLELEKTRTLEEKLSNGERFDVQMNDFARERVSLAIKKGDYKRAALYLLPYVEDEHVEATFAMVE